MFFFFSFFYIEVLYPVHDALRQFQYYQLECENVSDTGFNSYIWSDKNWTIDIVSYLWHGWPMLKFTFKIIFLRPFCFLLQQSVYFLFIFSYYWTKVIDLKEFHCYCDTYCNTAECIYSLQSSCLRPSLVWFHYLYITYTYKKQRKNWS